MTASYLQPSWMFSLGDPHNPLCGVVRDKDGELIMYRAVMNDDDKAIMQLIAAAPDMLATLKSFIEGVGNISGADNREAQFLERIEDAARAIIAKTEGRS